MKRLNEDGTSKSLVNIEWNIIADDFDPDEISTLMQLQFSRSFRKGEKVKNKPIIREYSLWGIETGYQHSWDVSEQMSQILMMIENRINIIKHILTRFKANTQIVVVIKFVEDDKPAIYFEKETLVLLHEINAEIQFDYYIL